MSIEATPGTQQLPTARRTVEDDLPDAESVARHPALTLPPEQLAGRIQHALIGQAITERMVRQHVEETARFGFDAAIVPPSWVWAARDELKGTSIRVGSFVDFPYGTMTTAGRVAEVQALVDAGVDELDSTINVGYLLSHRVPEFVADLRSIVTAAAPIGVKLMLELPLLSPAQRTRVVEAAVDVGAAFVTTASRGAVGIADAGTVRWLRRSVPASIGVKASGGVKTLEQVRTLLAAGADLIGTSSGVAIVGGRATAKGSLYSY